MLRTIRSRLVAGFGTSVGLLLVAGLLGWWGLSRSNAQANATVLALSDRDWISAYCILDSTIPLYRYVATVQLKRVTDGHRTCWHWESTFATPPGRERELTEQVGRNVYEAGFDALRTYLV